MAKQSLINNDCSIVLEYKGTRELVIDVVQVYLRCKILNWYTHWYLGLLPGETITNLLYTCTCFGR